jgi:hypothetical protein
MDSVSYLASRMLTPLLRIDKALAIDDFDDDSRQVVAGRGAGKTIENRGLKAFDHVRSATVSICADSVDHAIFPEERGDVWQA